MRTKGIFLAVFAAMIGIYGCQRTTVEGPGGKKLTLVKPADQMIKQGDTNQIMVRINRDNFRDAVTIRFDQLPAGIEVQDKDKKIDAAQSSATFTLKAENDAAPVEKQAVAVVAEGPDGMRVTEHFNLTVKAKGTASPSGAPAPGTKTTTTTETETKTTEPGTPPGEKNPTPPPAPKP